MSGLLALLDDVAALAKVAAASVDDISAQATKAGAKAAGAVIDDAAVTPKYLHGFSASRELPIVWRIARGSLLNKLLILLPVALVLSSWAPWAITPLLMLGGGYLCFEGAEKIAHILSPSPHSPAHQDSTSVKRAANDPAHLEEARVVGAIKTDFILSAEIMTIALSELGSNTLGVQAASLAVVAVGITALVYGGVALIVKADDVGLHLARHAPIAALRALGRGLVQAMPGVLSGLTAVGTAAMLWVGGSIVLHGLAALGLGAPAHLIEDLADQAAAALAASDGRVIWAVTALLDGLAGAALGLILLPMMRVFGK